MTSYTLRPYQSAAVSAAASAIEHRRNEVLSMPTGSGKSLVISGISTAMSARVVVLQPTKEILEQNYRKLYEFGYRDMAICSASMGRKERAQVTFATIGTIINRLDDFADTDLVIVDECHLVNAKAGQYRDFIKHLGVPAIGLTATPYRMAASFGGTVVEAKFLHRTRPRVFSQVGHITQNDELHDAGYLAPISYVLNPDYNPYAIALKSTGLNYDERALEAYNLAQGICQKIADAVVSNHDSLRHFLIFVASISESEQVERLLRQAGVSIAHLDGKTPKRERERILEDFQSGRIKAVTNVGVLTTGFDFPALDGIVLGRPTMSLPLYYQMVGRGVRVFEGKQACRVFDLCGNVPRFGEPDKYRIEADDGYKHRLRSGKRYLTGVNFVSGRDLEKQRDYRAKKADTGTITFGKHQGTKIVDAPIGYLEWCVDKFDDGKWKTLFIEELERRKGLAA